MLTFSSKGKAYLKRLGGKARVRKISSLPGESPSHSPPTLCLGSDLLSAPPHASSLSSPTPLPTSLSHSSPFSSELASDSSLSPGFLPSVLGVISSQNLQRKPGRMANLGPATTCPDSHRSPGRRTPFAPPLGEGLLLPQPPQQTTHMAGLGGSGKPPLTTHRAGSGGSRRPSATATRSASPPTEAEETFATLGEGLVLQPPQTSPMLGLGGSSTPPITSPATGSGGRRKVSETATRPASPKGKAREVTTASLQVRSAPTVVPPLAVTAQNSSAATATVTTQPHAAVNVTVPGSQWGPSLTPQGSATPWGSQWFPQPFMGGFPCPTQGQQPLPSWWQPLSSMQQLATLGLAQALPARMPFWPGSAPQPPASGAPLVPPMGSQSPGGATPSTPGPSLAGSARQQAPPQLGSSLERPGPILPPLDHADPILPPRDQAPESDNDSSKGSEWDEVSEQGSDVPPADQQLWSLAASLAQLSEYAPSALVEGGEVPQSQATGLTAAELALGAVARPSTSPPSLRESSMVATAVRRIQEEVRANHPEAAPASVPDFPGALPSGKFIRPGKPLFAKGVPLAHSAIPTATLRLSQDDMLLVPERSRLSKSPRLASIPERYLVDSEEMARRGLETTSVMDSFLGGLVGALRDPGSDTFQLRQDLDAPAILAFIQTLAQGLKASADVFARLHLNPILARRDLTMSASSVARTPALRSSLRSLPVSQAGLFNDHVQAVIRRQADVNRDMALHAAVPRFASAAPRQPAKRRPTGDYARSGPAPPKARKGNSPKGKGPGYRPSRPFQRPPASKPSPSKRSHPQ